MDTPQICIVNELQLLSKLHSLASQWCPANPFLIFKDLEVYPVFLSHFRDEETD